MDAVDRRAAAVLGWIAALVALFDGVAEVAGLKWLQEVEWPSDLYTFQHLDPEPIDVAVVGSSRSHYGLPPSGLDVCLSEALGRRTRSVGLNRLTAAAYAQDLVARTLLADNAPAVLVVEVAPETLNAQHFELDYNIASTAEPSDVPECLLHGRSPATCARPLLRGVENVAQLFDRPLADNAHITWMMLYEGGGQYCYSDDACRTRNATYDEKKRGRWQERMDRLIPSVREGRFVDYDVRGGIAAAHFRALLDRETARGVKVVVVNLPVAEAYQAQIPDEVYAEFLAAMRDELGPRGVPFVDLNTPDRQRDRASFVDPDHLNATGAERLTRALCTDTLAPLLAG
ncbi:MAG: hypothetical protein ACOZNI_33420 [Myxococcota bacterium]